MTLSRTPIIAFFLFLTLANAVNFISINGARRPGAPWSVSWKGLRGDPEDFFLCLGYSGPNSFSSDFRPFDGNFNCSSSRVSTAAGAARFNLPDIESDYYCFFASNSTANPMDFMNIFGQSDPFLLLMESNLGDQNTLSTDFIGQSLVTSGVGKDVPNPFPTAGDAVTLTNTLPSTPTTSVLSIVATQTVVASTEASTPLSTAVPPANTATTRIIAGTASGSAAASLLIFFVCYYQWTRRRKAAKQSQPTPYPAEVEANGNQAGDSKLGLRMVSLEDQLRLLRQQITDIQSTPRSSLGESRTPSGPIGGTRLSNDIGSRDLRPSPIIPGSSRHHLYQLYSPPPTYTNSRRSRNSTV